MNQFNWDQAFTLDFDLNNGLSKHADTTCSFINFTSSKVAPPVPKPVDVLIKSGFTSLAISQSLIFSSSLR